jgi:hypothetical protein
MKLSGMRRLVVTALGLSALSIALVATSPSVSAAIDPAIFTNNGCDVGNYSCLQEAQPSIFTSYGCDVGNYSCLYAATGYPTYQYRYPYYASTFYPYYYQPPTTYVVYLPTSSTTPPTTTTPTGTIVTGYTATVGQQVTTTVGGFTPGETVSAAVSDPNNMTVQIGSAPAAADGTVTVSLTFPRAADWKLTLHGQTSNKTVVNIYIVK